MDRERLKELLEGVRRDRRLSIDAMVRLVEGFGESFFKALETVREGRVKKYRFTPGPLVIHTVGGSKREYIILPDVWYCSCKGFYPRRLHERTAICYHLLAYKLAEALGLVREEELDVDRYDSFLSELKYGLE